MIRMIRATASMVLIILMATAAAAETPVERGRYLVEAVLACGNCHSPRTPPEMTIIPGKELSGGRSVDTPAFKVTPGNITQDKKTGIGDWTADELKAFLRLGVGPNGVPIAPAIACQSDQGANTLRSRRCCCVLVDSAGDRKRS